MGYLNFDDFVDMFDESVCLVCFLYCLNVVVEINFVVEIMVLVYVVGVFVCVDGVSYVFYGIFDVGGMGFDIYMFLFYKIYGLYQGIMVVCKFIGDILLN